MAGVTVYMVAQLILLSIVYFQVSGQGCDSIEWRAFGNSSYHLFGGWSDSHDPLPFTEAREFCNRHKGDLARLKTQEAKDFAQTLLSNQRAWIGLHDLDEECSFQWIDGSLLLDGMSTWNASEFELCHRDNDCMEMEGESWREQNCSVAHPFLCERSGLQVDLPARMSLISSTPFPDYRDYQGFRFLAIINQPDSLMSNSLYCESTSYEIYSRYDAYTYESHLRNSYSTILQSSLVKEYLASYYTPGRVECTATTSDNTQCTSVEAFYLRSSRKLQPKEGRFTERGNAGNNIILEVVEKELKYPWHIPVWTLFQPGDYYGHYVTRRDLSHTIFSASKSDEGVYVTFPEDDHFDYEYSVIKVIVQDCPEGRWGPPTCLGVCDLCFNGGVCHEQSGTCICPPGFSGKNCLTACGQHRFGWNCELECGLDLEIDVSCTGSQICLPDPYGCNCFSGYTGFYCNETCNPGGFGVDCLQECHCAGDESCDIYTGACPGDCRNEWTGPQCQVPIVCPNVYYGTNCGETCHCLNNTSCDETTGYCHESNGLCASGYENNPSDGTFCTISQTCFDSCTKTCHCSGGASECNTVTGECFSSKCLHGWTGNNCQIVSPVLDEAPSLIYADCDKIAITWTMWHPSDEGSEDPIGGYDVFLKYYSSDWARIAHVTHDQSSNQFLGHVITGLQPDTEYWINVSPVHPQSSQDREPNGPELAVNTSSCTAKPTETSSSNTTIVPAQSSSSASTVPWALFGILLVVVLICGGAFAIYYLRQRMNATNSTPGAKANDYTSSPPSSERPQPSGHVGVVYQNAGGREIVAALKADKTQSSSALYQNPMFSPDEPPTPHVYQGLNLPPPPGNQGDAYEVVSSFN